MSNIYLAGPMSNKPYFNFPAFEEATKKLEAQGHYVFSPAKVDVLRAGYNFSVDCPTGSREELVKAGVSEKINYKDCMRVDLNWILDFAEEIALLPDWDTSKGVAAEKALAECLGLKVMYL